MTWEETRARLEKTRAITPGLLGSDVVVTLDDIRAALERDTEWALKYDKLHDERHAEARKADALREENARLRVVCVLHGGTTDISHDCADEIRARISILTRERDKARAEAARWSELTRVQ